MTAAHRTLRSRWLLAGGLLSAASLCWAFAPPSLPPPPAGPLPAARPTTSPTPLVGGQERSRALLVALHGGSWKGRAPQQLAERLLRDFTGEARRAGLRLLVPIAAAADGGVSANAEAGGDPVGQSGWSVPWTSAAGQAQVLELITAELRSGRIDARRIYLAGHGAGATGALQVAARNPEVFAGVAVWSGTPAPLWDEHQQVIGLVDDPLPGLRGVPVYVWSGTDDEALDRGALALLLAGLREPRSAPVLIESGLGGHGLGPGPRAGLQFLRKQLKQQRR
ncbi:MAG: PHB depolymerase family esterase [Planctomycetota bacterium]